MDLAEGMNTAEQVRKLKGDFFFLGTSTKLNFILVKSCRHRESLLHASSVQRFAVYQLTNELTN
jgi:hypothetical protein